MAPPSRARWSSSPRWGASNRTAVRCKSPSESIGTITGNRGRALELGQVRDEVRGRVSLDSVQGRESRHQLLVGELVEISQNMHEW